MLLEPPRVHAPEFEPGPWIQSPSPLHLADMSGRACLVHVWDFTCINCLRTLPYLRAWHDRYDGAGLRIIGIHTPEFPFARSQRLVASAAARLGLRWPVLLDNDQRMWTAYANRYWPTMYLIDGRGYIRFRREGEGGYAETEDAFRALLAEIDPTVRLPDLVGSLRPEDEAGAVCIPTTPELQADSLAGGPSEPGKSLTLFPPAARPEGRWYAEGEWLAAGRSATLVGPSGRVVLPFRAHDVYAVLSSAAEADRLPLDPIPVRLALDGAPLPAAHYGSDVFVDSGEAWIRVDGPRLYHLASHLDPGAHELSLHAAAPGWTVFAFSFGSCLVPIPPAVPHEEAAPC
jgi:hypothetical protein